MMDVPALPPGFEQTRGELQRVATHVLARARAQASGRFGLRVTTDGIGTPQFGDGKEALRLSGTCLVRERQLVDTTRSDTHEIIGHSLAQLAEFAGLDLGQPFSVGKATPPIGDPQIGIDVDVAAVDAVWGWLRLGTAVLDRLLRRSAAPSVIQLWPEHFDVAFDLSTATGRVNLGASLGDTFHAEPYIYVGPWFDERPGDRAYWNAPFGAFVGHAELRDARDPVRDAMSFLGRGLDLLG